MNRAHYDEQAECLVVEVYDEHMPKPKVALVHWLNDNSGEFLDYPVRLDTDTLHALIEDLTAALQRIQTPTEGGTNDDTTDQGSPGGETAADDDRAGADSREVGAVVSEVPPAAEEGGVGEPSAGAPPSRPDCTSCHGTGVDTEDGADLTCRACGGSGDGAFDPHRCRFVYPPVAIQCVRSAPRGYTVCSDHGR